MGITIHYEFFCKDKKCVDRTIREVREKALELRRKFPSVQIMDESNNSIAISPHPESEWITLNFEPYKEKERRFKEKKWDLEYVKLTESRYVTLEGKPYDIGAGVTGVSFTEKFIKPKYGRRGYQTAGFTKTQYAGAEGHVLACKLFDVIRKETDKHSIRDEADFCGDGDKGDYGKLMDNMEANMAVIKNMMGLLEGMGYKKEQMGGSAPEYLEKVRRHR